MTEQRIASFETLTVGDVPRVGRKNASLGERVRTLKDKGVRAPDGFATTAAALREYVAANGIEGELRAHRGAAKRQSYAAWGRRDDPQAVSGVVHDGILMINPDSIVATLRRVAEGEQQFGTPPVPRRSGAAK